MNPSNKFSLILLVILMIFQAIGAIGGGLAWVFSPTGQLMQMPLSMLEHSPFPNFLIPGLFLLIVLGFIPAFECYALWKKPDSAFLTRLNPEGWPYSSASNYVNGTGIINVNTDWWR